ncbi:MAG: NAD(P)-binding domain-containing protein [Armatimonadota bacterium]
MEIKSYPRFAVVEAGHSGTAIAEHLALAGFDVSRYNRSPERLRPIQTAGGLEILSDAGGAVPRGFYQIKVVTTGPAEAIAERDIAMVAAPATGHRFIAEQLAPHLGDGQFVVRNKEAHFGDWKTFEGSREACGVAWSFCSTD